MNYLSDIKEILYSPRDIDERIQGLAKQIQTDYNGEDVVIISILKGSFIFTSDLIRYINLRLTIDFIHVSSYREGMTSKELIINKGLSSNINNKHVLLIDDIIDTGNTLKQVKEILTKENPLSIKTCVLYNKPSGRKVEMVADYVAYDVGNYFIVGYGLDYNEKYRNLPFVGILREEAITKI